MSRRSSARSTSAAALRVGLAQRQCCVYECKMAEGLRKVAELSPELRIVLLGEQSEIVPRPGRSLEEPSRVLLPTHHLIDHGEPERAREEYALIAGEPVDVGLGLEAQQEAILQELALERLDGADDARVGGRQEAAQGYEEETGVEALASVVLRECIERGVEPLATHLVEDGLPSLAQIVDLIVKAGLLYVS